MEDLRLYDFEFNLLCSEPLVISAVWEVKFNGIGTFEARLSPKSKLIKIALENNYLVAVQGQMQAIITTKSFENDSFVLYGRTVNYILSKRVVTPFNINDLQITKNAQSLVRYLVTTYFGDCITLADEIQLDSSEINFYRYVTYTLSEVICDCLDKVNAGHKVVFDTKNKKWVFECLKSSENCILISEDNNTAYEASYLEDLLNYANGGYYLKYTKDSGDWDAGQNLPPLSAGLEDNLGKIYYVTNPGTRFGKTFQKGDYICCVTEDGAWQKTDYISEYYIKIESDKSGIYKWEAILSGNSKSEAEKSLKSKNLTREIDTKVRNIRFEEDYNVGDTVRVQKKIGDKILDSKKIIDSVQIWFENQQCGQKPHFKEVEE